MIEPSVTRRPKPALGRGLTWRIALVGFGSAIVAVGIITVGVWVIGSEALAKILMEYGDTAAHAYGMFDQSIRDVLLVAMLVGILASVGLAVMLSRMITRPLAEVGAARIAMQQGTETAAGHFRLKNICHQTVGFAGVQNERQVHLARNGDMDLQA